MRNQLYALRRIAGHTAQRALVARVLLCLACLALVAAAWAGPKNIILMIGDGMGPDSKFAAGAYRYGKDYHAFGGDKLLSLETLAGHYYVTTYPVSGSYDFTWQGGNREYPWKRATDSAAAGTAMATGTKTYYGAVNMDVEKHPLKTIVEIAKEHGLKTGVVTTMPFSNATPACFGAHNVSRANYQEITHEMLTTMGLDVIMGAGNPEVAPESIPGRADLTPRMVKYLNITQQDWDALTGGTSSHTLVQTREEFQRLIGNPVKGKVFGAYRAHALLTHRMADGKSADPALPTLAEMAKGALATLENPNGFFVMIEGGAIDERNHVNDLDGCVGETLGFDEAVTAVLDWINTHGGWEQNLLIITADHETGYLHDIKPTGVGQLPDAIWGTDGTYGGHTNRLVDLYCQGAGSDAFAGYAKDETDFERGKVRAIDDTDIFRVMNAALPATAGAR